MKNEQKLPYFISSLTGKMNQFVKIKSVYLDEEDEILPESDFNDFNYQSSIFPAVTVSKLNSSKKS